LQYVCRVIVQQPRPQWLVFGLGACLWYVPCNTHGREPLDRDSVSRSVDVGWPKSAFYIQHMSSLPEAPAFTSSVRLIRWRRLAESRTSSQLCAQAHGHQPSYEILRSPSRIKCDTLNDFFEAAARICFHETDV
jgi:hypothetical protein